MRPKVKDSEQMNEEKKEGRKEGKSECIMNNLFVVW